MKKIIFDVDGTILDSMHIWIEPQNRIFEKYGFKLQDLPVEEKAIIEALSYEDMCQYIADDIATDMSYEEVKSYFDDIINEAYSNELMPVEGGIEMLNKLKEAGFSMSVASSTNYTYLEMALKRLGIHDYFDFFATPDVLGLKKSDPEYWKYSIDKHGIDSKDLILFDDALYALKAAKKEGIEAVGLKDFPWNKNEWQAIEEVADYTLDSIADIDINKLQ